MDKKREPQKEIVWRAAEYEHVQKDVLWYLASGVVALGFVILALIQRNFFFAVFILIAEALVLFFGKRRPQILDFRINERGIAIGNNVFYDYADLAGFAIVKQEGRLDEVVLKRNTQINPYLKMPIDAKLAAEAKLILENKLPEMEYEISLIDVLADRLRF